MGMMQGIYSNSMQIIKSIVLPEDHTNVAIANQKYWKEYLAIDDQSNDYLYFCLFYNPDYTNAYKVNAIFYQGNSVCDLYRNEWSYFIRDINTNDSQYYLFATQGTEISVCKMKKT